MFCTHFLRLLSFKLFALLMLLLIILFSFYMYINLKLHTSHLMANVIASANRTSDLIKKSTRYSMLKNQKEDVDQIITTLGNLQGVDGIRIYNKKGLIMFSGRKEETGEAVDMKAEACYVCHSEKIPKKTLPSINRTRIFYSQKGYRVLGLINPIDNEPDCSNASCHAHPASIKVLGVLDVKMSLAQVDRNIRESENKMIFFAVLFILTVGIVSGVFIWFMVHNPVKKLTIGTQEISKGNLDYQIDVKSKDEIGQLAKSFAYMMQELKKAYEEITNWSKTLEKRVKEKSEELERTQAHIVRVEKMASLGKLSATVAHEINNPLGGILTYTKLLIKKLEKLNIQGYDESIIKFLKIIENESKRCGRIVKDLLVFAKSSSVNFQQENLKNVVPVLCKPDDPMLFPSSADLVFICDTYHHIEKRNEYLKLLKKYSKPEGRIAIIDYQKKETPHGPPLSMRISKEDIVKEITDAGYKLEAEFFFLPYQYFLVFRK